MSDQSPFFDFPSSNLNDVSRIVIACETDNVGVFLNSTWDGGLDQDCIRSSRVQMLSDAIGADKSLPEGVHDRPVLVVELEREEDGCLDDTLECISLSSKSNPFVIELEIGPDEDGYDDDLEEEDGN